MTTRDFAHSSPAATGQPVQSLSVAGRDVTLAYVPDLDSWCFSARKMAPSRHRCSCRRHPTGSTEDRQRDRPARSWSLHRGHLIGILPASTRPNTAATAGRASTRISIMTSRSPRPRRSFVIRCVMNVGISPWAGRRPWPIAIPVVVRTRTCPACAVGSARGGCRA